VAIWSPVGYSQGQLAASLSTMPSNLKAVQCAVQRPKEHAFFSKAPKIVGQTALRYGYFMPDAPRRVSYSSPSEPISCMLRLAFRS
jgi:hypothetical protein